MEPPLSVSSTDSFLTMIYETVRAPLRAPPSRAYIQCELDRLRKGGRCNFFCPPTPDHSSTILAELIKSDASDDALCARKHEILLPIVRAKATAYDELRPYRATSLSKHELEALTCGYHRDKTRTIGAIRKEVVSAHFEDWLREACGQVRRAASPSPSGATLLHPTSACPRPATSLRRASSATSRNPIPRSWSGSRGRPP